MSAEMPALKCNPIPINTTTRLNMSSENVISPLPATELVHAPNKALFKTIDGCEAAASVQETMDFALISQVEALRARLPFVHFFDGFRTSHEVSKIEIVGEEVMRALMDDRLVAEHRARAMTPDQPVLRGTAQNPDA